MSEALGDDVLLGMTSSYLKEDPKDNFANYVTSEDLSTEMHGSNLVASSPSLVDDLLDLTSTPMNDSNKDNDDGGLLLQSVSSSPVDISCNEQLDLVRHQGENLPSLTDDDLYQSNEKLEHDNKPCLLEELSGLEKEDDKKTTTYEISSNIAEITDLERHQIEESQVLDNDVHFDEKFETNVLIDTESGDQKVNVVKQVDDCDNHIVAIHNTQIAIGNQIENEPNPANGSSPSRKLHESQDKVCKEDIDCNRSAEVEKEPQPLRNVETVVKDNIVVDKVDKNTILPDPVPTLIPATIMSDQFLEQTKHIVKDNAARSDTAYKNTQESIDETIYDEEKPQPINDAETIGKCNTAGDEIEFLEQAKPTSKVDEGFQGINDVEKIENLNVSSVSSSFDFDTKTPENFVNEDSNEENIIIENESLEEDKGTQSLNDIGTIKDFDTAMAEIVESKSFEKPDVIVFKTENQTLKVQLESALDQIRLLESRALDQEETISQFKDKLTVQMTSRAEAENKSKELIQHKVSLEKELKDIHSQHEESEAEYRNEIQSLLHKNSSLTEENKRMAFELAKSRQNAESLETTVTALTSRLNEAKKVEAAKSREANRNADKVAILEEELFSMKNKNTKQESLQQGTAEKLRSLEESLDKERQLNITRKAKMKSYVDQKSGEMKTLKEANSRLSQEISHWKTEQNEMTSQKIELENQVSNLIEKLSLVKNENEVLQAELSNLKKTATETEKEIDDLKKKRITAKNETMSLFKSLELERAISSKLQHELKYTLLPKALSQQELLSESLRSLQGDLEVLTRTKFSSQAAIYERDSNPNGEGNQEANLDRNDIYCKEKNGCDDNDKSGKDPEYVRLISDVENESKKVSMAILALSSNVDKLHELTVNDMHYSVGERTCVSAFTDFLMGASSTHVNQLSGSIPRRSSGYANVTQNHQ